MKQLAENVFYENTYPTYGFVATPGGVLAVDGPMKPSVAAAWRDAVAARGRLVYHVNTEHHQDHIASNWFLGAQHVVASEMTDADFYKSLANAEEAKERMLKYEPGAGRLIQGYQLRPPDIVFRGRMTLRLGGRAFCLIHAPGHTRGQTVVHCPGERVAFVADNLTPDFNVAFHSASVWEWFQTLGMLEALDVDWYVPGHGEPCTKAEFPAQRQKMHEIIGKVREMKRRGMTREEAQAQAEALYATPFESPRLGERLLVLHRGGVGNIYDALDEHPSGGLSHKEDPVWPNV